jgi:hypothetical protein
MLGEEEGLSSDLTGHSSGRRSYRCGCGDGGDMSSGESEFLHKRNLKEGKEWIQRRIVRLPVTFIR